MDIRLAGLAMAIELTSAAAPSAIATTPAATTAATFAFGYRVTRRVGVRRSNGDAEEGLRGGS